MSNTLSGPGSTAAAPTRSTRAAEGLSRWRWTTAEIEAVVEAGLLASDSRFELIGGEIVPMSPKGRRHELVVDALCRHWRRKCPDYADLCIERQFNLDEATYTDPDILVLPTAIMSYDAKGPDALLVVEVSDSSFGYDSEAKAAVYARFGVREYWVIHAPKLTLKRHADPRDGRYTSCDEYDRHAMLVPTFVPELTLRLSDLVV